MAINSFGYCKQACARRWHIQCSSGSNGVIFFKIAPYIYTQPYRQLGGQKKDDLKFRNYNCEKCWSWTKMSVLLKSQHFLKRTFTASCKKDWRQLKNRQPEDAAKEAALLSVFPSLCWTIIRQRCSFTVWGSVGSDQQGCVYFPEVVFYCLPHLFIFSVFVSPSSCTVITCTTFICLSPVWLSLPLAFEPRPSCFLGLWCVPAWSCWAHHPCRYRKGCSTLPTGFNSLHFFFYQVLIAFPRERKKDFILIRFQEKKRKKHIFVFVFRVAYVKRQLSGKVLLLLLKSFFLQRLFLA